MTEERFCHKLGDQPQLIQGPGMLGAGGDEVDAGGLLAYDKIVLLSLKLLQNFKIHNWSSLYFTIF